MNELKILEQFIKDIVIKEASATNIWLDMADQLFSFMDENKWKYGLDKIWKELGTLVVNKIYTTEKGQAVWYSAIEHAINDFELEKGKKFFDDKVKWLVAEKFRIIFESRTKTLFKTYMPDFKKISENVLDQQHQIKTPGTRGPYGTPTYIQKDDKNYGKEKGILKKVKKELDKKPYTLHNPPMMGLSITNPKLKDRPGKNQLSENRLYGPAQMEPKIFFKYGPQKKLGIKVEVKDTAEGRKIGLMYRDKLHEGTGMLFVFPFPMQQKFWMKNTFMPLDMIFITPDKRVLGTVTNTEPLSENLYHVDGDSMYVLEVPAGFVEKYGITSGMPLEFAGIPLIGKR